MGRQNKNNFKSKGKKHYSSNGNKKNLKKSKPNQNKHFLKFMSKTQNQEAEERLKQQRLRQLQKQNLQNASSESEEEEIENPLNMLISTFKTHESESVVNAIESDSDALTTDDENDLTDESDISDSDISVNMNIEGDLDNADLDMHLENNSSEEAEISDIDDLKQIDTVSADIKIDEKVSYEEDHSGETIDIFNGEDTPLLDSDKFCVHLNNELSPELLNVLSTKPIKVSNHELSWPSLGKLLVDIPITDKKCTESSAKSLDIDGVNNYAHEGTVPEKINLKSLNWDKIGIKQQLRSHIATANADVLQKYNNCDILTPLQSELFSIINGYQDVYYPERSLALGEDVRLVYCLHAMNHVLKTRTKVLHHNSKILQQNGEIPDYFRDQGFVRPRVLIVVPFRDSALKVVRILTSLLVPGGGGRVQNSLRFEKEYGGESIIFPKHNPKPEDYEQLFSGNTDDTFRLGIAVTKKSVKLYADYYGSDIIVASPLGLRVAVGAPGETHRDYDFLSSVELLIMDQADVFLAQNWDHVLHVMDHMHLQPKETHDTDFARVRMWALNGHSKLYRQTIVFSAHDAPQLRALTRLGGRCTNYRGSVRIANPIAVGSICEVVVTLPQVFHRIGCDSATQAIEARFNYFTKKVLSQYRGPAMAQCLLYIPDYFDYVRLRNYFKREEINFTQICEYTKESKMARARDMFFHGASPIMLYSERAHYFRRSRIKGIRHILFYQPPGWPKFYSEMCNLMQEANQNPRTGVDSNMTVTVLFTKYDIIQIANIVGTERAAQLAHSVKDVHMFMTGDY